MNLKNYAPSKAYSDWLDNYLPFLKIELLSKYKRWQKVAKILKVSPKAELRLKWIIYYHTKANYNASLTARYFGISRKTFYKWFNYFDEDNLYTLHCLEDRSRAPQHVRQPEITPQEEARIIKLRNSRIKYGKLKLAKLYHQEYKEQISSWKIQRVIRNYNLYPNPVKTARTRTKRQRAIKKKRITELNFHNLPAYKKTAGYIICLDTIVIYYGGLKRYIFTAIDKYAKVAFARMYKSKSSINSKDFLLRLYYLLDGQFSKVGHDNGSEFEKHFKKTCQELKIKQYYSRLQTPKDNPNNERFNQTLQYEFIKLGNFHSDPEIFNPRLTEWLIEYNFKRPHQALNYQTPIKHSKVLPMYSSCTISLQWK